MTKKNAMPSTSKNTKTAESARFNFERSTGFGKEGRSKALAVLRAKRGRPRKGVVVAATRARSVRLPDEVWEEIAREARRLGVTDATLVRAAVTHWLETNPHVKTKARAEHPRKAASS
jgi:hypothetical protein